MTELTDLELLALVHACDEHAMAVIFDRHSTVVYSVALQVSGLPFEAKRVLQEVLMAVWRVPTGVLASGLSLKQWVGLEARRVAIQMKRSYYPDPVCDSSAGSSRSDARGLLTIPFLREDAATALRPDRRFAKGSRKHSCCCHLRIEDCRSKPAASASRNVVDLRRWQSSPAPRKRPEKDDPQERGRCNGCSSNTRGNLQAE